MTRSYYSNDISSFLRDNETYILGELARNHSHALEDLQKNAWIKQIKILKEVLGNASSGHIYFEFSIPRMGKRADNILIINDFIFVLEFKVGDTHYHKYATEQVLDYCLDLQNFHEGSHNEKIVPILVATRGEDLDCVMRCDNNMFYPIKANGNNLWKIITNILSASTHNSIDVNVWENSIYKPTPTIVEAAQALYRGHNVNEISRNDAGAYNLSVTTACINEIIEATKRSNGKAICFLTGVPGAGKTLAGLNIANQRMQIGEDEHAVFLSGNGPLVEVLREALTRDEVVAAKERGESLTKKQSAIKANAFIQNIHHFRDDNLKSTKAPIEKVVIFDEAQRAWTKEQASSFMKRKKSIEDFGMSEPEFLISVMDRHKDWCTIVCLIGGGQEINTGEAGISEWLVSLKEKYTNWAVYYSHLIASDTNYLSNALLREWIQTAANPRTELHLSVSVRSFRSERVSELMHHILKADAEKAKCVLSEIEGQFPIFITRNLSAAKQWLRKMAKGSERFGVVASSGGKRLRPFGIDVKNEISAPYWFLNPSDDIRSSNYLEDVATEFDIQGLEIDWVCLAWDINCYHKEKYWNYQFFEGTAWKNMRDEKDREYLLNAYRVLLTRARQGLVIYVPNGDEFDSTRPLELYDSTYDFFRSCGIRELSLE